MKLANTNYWIWKGKDGKVATNMFDGSSKTDFTPEQSQIVSDVYSTFKKRTITYTQKIDSLKRLINQGVIVDLLSSNVNIELNKDAIEQNIQNLINFFTEFSFEPNFRFINTFAYASNKNKASAKAYVSNYFELIDHQDVNQINEKMKSEEFSNLVESFAKIMPTHKVNSRLKIYYGSQGAGKTTAGEAETLKNTVTCNSAMLPSDLMEDFKFEDGKATFIPSALQKAMVEGKKIMLDELNLLPFESLRFLQTILDGKTQFVYKGKTIEIKEGFQVIGTMNLSILGTTYALPEPLVDRCEEIRKFKLSAKDLVGAIC